MLISLESIEGELEKLFLLSQILAGDDNDGRNVGKEEQSQWKMEGTEQLTTGMRCNNRRRRFRVFGKALGWRGKCRKNVNGIESFNKAAGSKQLVNSLIEKL